MGYYAGATGQLQQSIAIGCTAGAFKQAQQSIAIGSSAGQTYQGNNAIAMGYYAGSVLQGSNTIAIGNKAGQTSQPQNSIVLNASSLALNGATTGAFYVNPVRQVSAGVTAAGYPMFYNTSSNEIVYNVAKSFIIDHPQKPASHYLVHACLEGPEAGVYYRGKATITNDESIKITLPEYVESFATNFTIQITPIMHSKYQSPVPKIYGTTEITNNEFEVFGANHTSFHWVVYGERQSIQVEPRKDKVHVSGDGPYKYISKYNM